MATRRESPQVLVDGALPGFTRGSAYDCPILNHDEAVAHVLETNGEQISAAVIRGEIADRLVTCAGAVMTHAGFACCLQNGGKLVN